MLQGEHSALLSTFIKLLFVIKIFVLSILSGRFTQVLLYLNVDHLTSLDTSEWAINGGFYAYAISTKISCADQKRLVTFVA